MLFLILFEINKLFLQMLRPLHIKLLKFETKNGHNLNEFETKQENCNKKDKN